MTLTDQLIRALIAYRKTNGYTNEIKLCPCGQPTVGDHEPLCDYHIDHD